MSFLNQRVAVAPFDPYDIGNAKIVTVDNTVEMNNAAPLSDFDIDIESSSITVSYDRVRTDGTTDSEEDGFVVSGPGGHGVAFSDVDGTIPDILAVRVATTDVPDFEPSDVTFDADTIFLTFGNSTRIQTYDQQSIFSIDVNFAAPVAGDDDAGTDFQVPVNIDVLDNDDDSDGTLDPDTVAVTDQGTKGTATVNPDGTITYTPNAGASGEDSFTYTVQDDFGVTSNAATVTVTIAPPPNQPPTAANDGYSIAEDNVLTVAAANGVLANDSDPDGDPLAAALVTNPTNGSLTLNEDGSFTYTPDPDFFGQDSFTYTASDGQEPSDPATVTLTVDPVNDAPVATNDTADTTLLTAVDILVLGNDTDIDSTLDPASVTVTTDPANGTAIANPDGTITYTPNFLFTGEDSFTYTAGDDAGATSSEATVAVTVALDHNPITGTSGSDFRVATNGDDLIQTLDGQDTVFAKGGDDLVLGGEAIDTLFGQNGDDILMGGAGNDALAGGSGLDILVGGPGNDTLMGGSGLDTAIFEGAFADHRITGIGTWRTVQDQAGDGGSDGLTSVELLQFDDGVFDARNGQFTEGAFATAEVEALVTSPGFTTDPEPFLAPVA